MSSPKSAEAAIILDMLKFAKESTATNLEGDLIVFNGNELLCNEINEKWQKAGNCASDDGGMVAKTKDLIRTVLFELKFKLTTKHNKRAWNRQ